MPTDTVPTDRPAKRRPVGLTVTPHDVAAYGPAGALILTALTAGPATHPQLGEATGLDASTLLDALVGLVAFGRVVADPLIGWRLVDKPATDLDACPTCRKRISDVDPDGCETASGQRYCLAHLPREADPELYDSYRACVAGEAR